MSMKAGLNLETEDYMELVMAQMENQNPMDPMDNSQMLSQLSDLVNMESVKDMKGGFEDVLGLVSVTGGANLVGREVEYEQDGEVVRSTVEAVRASDGSLSVQVEDGELGLGQINRVLS